jgi:hypothetical protein
MISPETWKAIHDDVKAAWVVVGPLAGVVIGGWLARSAQRKHWVLDNKRAEYRKLLSTLTDSASKCLVAYARGSEGRDLKIAHQAIRSCTNVIYNRIFIAASVQRLDVMKRWTQLVDSVARDGNTERFQQILDQLTADIRQAAIKELS